MSEIRIPKRLRAAAESSDQADFRTWLAGIPSVVADLSDRWELKVGDPFEPGGQCAWVAPALKTDGERVALKVGWRHAEAEHESSALAAWAGKGVVRVLCHEKVGDTNALLLERCEPGVALSASLPERDRDPVIAELLLLVREAKFVAAEFSPLSDPCDRWASELERNRERQLIDKDFVTAAIRLLRSMPRDRTQQVLLFTDLHGDNVLSSQRKSWLAIDPKPHVGDPAFDVVQHIGTSYSRMESDPLALVARMSKLAKVDESRVRQWLFCRAVQERPGKPWLQPAITQLADVVMPRT